MISFSDMCKQIYHNSIHCISKDIQLCYLFKANFSTKEINMLTRQSLQTIYQRKTQIRQKLSILEKTLERHIKTLKDAGLVEYRGSKKQVDIILFMIEMLAMRE